jgi:excisionase family DNA binding protein
MMTLPKKDLLRPAEVAAYFSLSTKTIYGWIDQGKLEAVKIGGTIRITREAVEGLLTPKE